jgi:hypothetical protein
MLFVYQGSKMNRLFSFKSFLAILTVLSFIWYSYWNAKKSISNLNSYEALQSIFKHQDTQIDRELLGRSTWNLLHALGSANQKNSLQRKLLLFDFIIALSLIYPCPKCAPHFQKYVKNNPPLMEHNNSFALWLCRFHNSVNQRLGKPIFDCTNNSIISPCSTCDGV